MVRDYLDRMEEQLRTLDDAAVMQVAENTRMLNLLVESTVHSVSIAHYEDLLELVLRRTENEQLLPTL